MSEYLYVTAKFKIKADKLSESLVLIKNLTKETNANEKGCVEYYYLQSTTDNLEFTSFEVWENEQEEAKHWQTPYVQAALSQMPELLASAPEIIKWKKI